MGLYFGLEARHLACASLTWFPFNKKIKTSAFSLEIPALENIPQFPENRADVDQNHDARKAVSATLSVLKWSGAIFWPKCSNSSPRYSYLCSFLFKPRPSGVSLESPGLQYISQVPENGEDVGQNHDARKAVSATLSVLKWSGATLLPKSLKVSV